MNAEIVNRLEESFDDSTAPDIEHLLATATASAVEAAVNAVLDKLETGGAPMEEVIRALQQGQNQGEDPAQRE